MKINIKQKKAILGVGILICFAVALDKIYSFYKSFQPPFEVGECFVAVTTKVGKIEFKIQHNDRKKHLTTAVGRVEFLPGIEIQVPIQVSFEEIRNLDPEKVECSK